MKKTLIVLFIFLASFTCFGQDAKDNPAKTAQPAEWVRVQNATGEFSVEMPSNFVYFFDKDGFSYDSFNQSNYFRNMEMLNAAFEKTVMSVEIYKVSAPKKYLEEVTERLRLKGTQTEESQDGFTIKQFTEDKHVAYGTKKETTINFVTRLIASKSFLYVVTVANRGAASEAATRFLSSIRLNQVHSGTEKIINLSAVKPITLDQIAEMAKEDDKPKQDQKDKPVETPENPVIILIRPQVSYTEEARNAGISGTIRVRVTFEKDGRISRMSVLKGLPNGLIRNAVMAALRIKFLPQEKENQLETAAKTVEYSFSIR